MRINEHRRALMKATGSVLPLVYLLSDKVWLHNVLPRKVFLGGEIDFVSQLKINPIAAGLKN